MHLQVSPVTIVVNVHDTKTNFFRLLEQTRAGKGIVLANAGKPYELLVPINREISTRQPGRLHGAVTEAFSEPLSDEELATWEPR
jgi:antitoxin (DNA-binding transcriptional repressor) of toxin-antitoxin stability system